MIDTDKALTSTNLFSLSALLFHLFFSSLELENISSRGSNLSQDHAVPCFTLKLSF